MKVPAVFVLLLAVVSLGWQPSAATAKETKESRPLRIPDGAKIPPLPNAEEVTEISLQVSSSGNSELTCVVPVTSRSQVANILAQLGRIDWSQEGLPLDRVQLISPDIELTVFEKSGVHRQYSFYWEEKAFVDGVTGRLLEADVAGLRTVVIDALIRHLAAQQAKPAEPDESGPRLDTRP